MYCRNCGNEIGNNESKCSVCGAANSLQITSDLQSALLDNTVASVETKELYKSSKSCLARGILSMIFFWTIIVSTILISINVVSIPLNLLRTKYDFLGTYDKALYTAARRRLISAIITSIAGLAATIFFLITLCNL